MPETETLFDVFVDELKDAYDAEKQLIKALRKMSKAASHPDVVDAFATHMAETEGQVAILEEVFEMIDEPVKGKHCPGIAGIIEEGAEAIEEKEKSALLDACLIGGGKRAEHYEIAAYSTLIAMARELGRDGAADRLQEILDQELATDRKLDELAKALLPAARMAGSEEGNEDESEEESAPARRSAKKSASKSGGRKSTSRR